MDERTCETCTWLGWWCLHPTGPLPYCTCPFSTVRETKLERGGCECWEKVDHGPAA